MAEIRSSFLLRSKVLQHYLSLSSRQKIYLILVFASLILLFYSVWQVKYVIVDLSDTLDELDVFTPAMIEERAEIKDGDILYIHTGWHKYAQFGSEPDEEKYIHRHPGPHFEIVDWLLEKKIHLWGVDMVSTDHPMNLPIGRFLGKGGLEHWKKVASQCEEKFGKKEVEALFPDMAYQLTHNALFPHDCIHVENLGGDIAAPELQNKRITLGCFPWLFKGGEAAFSRAVAFV